MRLPQHCWTPQTHNTRGSTRCRDEKRSLNNLFTRSLPVCVFLFISEWREMERVHEEICTGQESMSLIASLPSANWMSGTGLERGLTEFWRICWRKLNGHRMCNICTYFIITDSRISCFSATFVLIKHQQQQQEAGREGSRGSPATTGFCESICMYLHVVELCRLVDGGGGFGY